MVYPGGYSGKILRVDLSNGKITQEEIAGETLRQFLGGSGLGAKIIYDEIRPGVEPFDDENRLVFTTGPFTGTGAPGSGTFCVTTKGTLTNFAASSQSNGWFGARLKFAGFDGVIIQGAAKKLSYLCIHDGTAEIRNATHLAGKDTWETEDLLLKELGQPKASVACIGPAAENLVRFGGVFCDKGHLASSNGVGTVMGSKKLKAIVAWGNATVPVRDRSLFKSLQNAWRETALEGNKLILTQGTAGYFPAAERLGWLPVKNYTASVYPATDRFVGSTLRQNLNMKKKPCYACPLTHVHDVEITEGVYKGFRGEEPEFEGLAGFTISLAMECYEKGLITKKDTDGVEMTWGNVEAVLSMLDKIARREGFGDILAEGVKRSAQRIGKGAEEFAVHMGKGNAPHVHDHRAWWDEGFLQFVSDTGSLGGVSLEFKSMPEVGFNEPIPLYSAEWAPRAISKTCSRRLLDDSLGVCSFLLWGRLEPVVASLNAVTGWTFDNQEALQVGERAVHLLRAFNIRQGLTPELDSLSPRYLQPPVDGPARGKSIAPFLKGMVRDYYRLMGWDEETSKPLPETLRRIGLDYVINDLR